MTTQGDPIAALLQWLFSMGPGGDTRSPDANMRLGQNALGMGTMVGGVNNRWVPPALPDDILPPIFNSLTPRGVPASRALIPYTPPGGLSTGTLRLTGDMVDQPLLLGPGNNAMTAAGQTAGQAGSAARRIFPKVSNPTGSPNAIPMPSARGRMADIVGGVNPSNWAGITASGRAAAAARAGGSAAPSAAAPAATGTMARSSGLGKKAAIGAGSGSILAALGALLSGGNGTPTSGVQPGAVSMPSFEAGMPSDQASYYGGGGMTAGDVAGMSPGEFSTGNPVVDAAYRRWRDSMENGGGDTESQRINANANMIQAQSQAKLAEAQIANYLAQQEIAKRDAAVSEGNLELAKQHETNAQIWQQRAADSQDIANTISASSQEIDAYQAMEQSTQGRAGMKARGAENLTSLTNVLGGIAQAQAELQFKLNSTPRNAIAAMLMGRGASQPGAMQTQGAYQAPGNLLGLDTNSFAALIQRAIGEAGQVGTMPAPQFDLTNTLSNLSTAGQQAQSMLGPGRTPAAPIDATGNIVGNRIPGR